MSVHGSEVDSPLAVQQSEPSETAPAVAADKADNAPVEQPDVSVDWSELERRFTEEMARREQEESEIAQDFQKLAAFYEVWLRVPAEHEVDRASQRLRTRIAFVQAEERELEGKRQHHKKVVQAFQNALDLLRDP